MTAWEIERMKARMGMLRDALSALMNHVQSTRLSNELSEQIAAVLKETHP